MIIDHVGLAISDYARSKEFFKRVLAPLGIELAQEYGGSAGFGRDGKPEFWISESATPQRPMHIAFRAKTRADVRAFYEAAIGAGAADNGPPGLRAHYHSHYYGAFVIDPDGHNIEAVCHAHEDEA